MSILESPFSRYLDTNHVPSTQQMGEIISYLKEPQDRLVQVDSEIRQLSFIIENLDIYRAKLRNEVDKHLALLHPLRRVPQDIIQEIFMHCIPTIQNPTLSATEAPTLLTRICGSWRSIALSTPSLWSRVHLAIPNLPFSFSPWTLRGSLPEEPLPERLQQLVDLRTQAVQTWISRSGVCPLSISIHIPSINQAGADQVADALLPFSRRWYQLELNTSPSCVDRILNIDVAKVPNLKVLKIMGPQSPRSWGGNTAGVVESRKHIFAAPSIKEVVLDIASDDLLSFPFNWPRLTHFTKSGYMGDAVYGFSVYKATKLLMRCSDLVSCHLEIIYPELDAGCSISSPISLPRLESLRFFEGVPCQSLVERLDVPMLQEIVFSTSLPWKKQLSLPTLLQSTHGSVKALTINTLMMKKEDIVACLRLVPNLQKLVAQYLASSTAYPNQAPTEVEELVVYDIDDDILQLLSPESTQPGGCLCPRLEAFHYLINNISGRMSDNMIISFIRSRFTNIPFPSLKSVAFTLNRSQELDIKAAISQLIPSTFIFRVKYGVEVPSMRFPLDEGLPLAPSDDLDASFAAFPFARQIRGMGIFR